MDKHNNTKREVKEIKINKGKIERELQKASSTEVLAKAIKSVINKNKYE